MADIRSAVVSACITLAAFLHWTEIVRVFGIAEGDLDSRIDRTIAATEAFFRSLGLTTRLSEEGIGEETIEEIARRFTERGTALGEKGNIDGKVAREILLRAL